MYSTDDFKRDPILAAVGQLQIEVVQFRLQNEYNVETRTEPLPYSVARWVHGGWEALEKAGRIFNSISVKDNWGRPVLLFKNEWNLVSKIFLCSGLNAQKSQNIIIIKSNFSSVSNSR